MLFEILLISFLYFQGTYCGIIETTTPTSPPSFTSESDLRRDLFRNYDKLVRPVKNYKDVVPVSMGLAPLAIEEMDETNEIFALHSWIAMHWHDDYLRWDPQQYDGIASLHVPAIEVWRPDLILYTAASDQTMKPHELTQVIIYHNGSVLWVPPFTFRNRCPIVKDGNAIECLVKIGSWTFSDKQMDLEKYSEEVDLSNFQNTNPQWEIVSVKSQKESKKYPCCVETYSSINYTFRLKNKHYSKPNKSAYLQSVLEKN